MYILILSLIFNCKAIKLFATGYMNRLTYLYQNGNYWSMSPGHFNSGASFAYEFIQHADGTAYGSNSYVTIGLGVRPVINLQSDDLMI